MNLERYQEAAIEGIVNAHSRRDPKRIFTVLVAGACGIGKRTIVEEAIRRIGVRVLDKRAQLGALRGWILDDGSLFFKGGPNAAAKALRFRVDHLCDLCGITPFDNPFLEADFAAMQKNIAAEYQEKPWGEEPAPKETA